MTDDSGLVLPDDPLARHALTLRLLAQQCLALADRTEQDGYPYWPEAPIQLAHRSLVAALATLARNTP